MPKNQIPKKDCSTKKKFQNEKRKLLLFFRIREKNGCLVCNCWKQEDAKQFEISHYSTYPQYLIFRSSVKNFHHSDRKIILFDHQIVYDLIAVEIKTINHSTALCLYGNDWYLCNDRHVDKDSRDISETISSSVDLGDALFFFKASADMKIKVK